MKILTEDQYKRAKTYVERNARPVDSALFRYFFERGEADHVIEQVAEYQNDDGGFGHAIEPDFRLPESSPAATVAAFAYLRAVDAPPAHPVVTRAIDYLLATVDRRRWSWRPVPRTIDDYPAAPWWTYQEWVGRGPAEWGNPNAELIAALVAYAPLVPPNDLDDAVRAVERALDVLPDAPAMHVFLCFLRLARVAPPTLREQLVRRLRPIVRKITALEETEWWEYSLRPCWVVPRPSAIFYDELADELSRNLDFEIANQTANGSWVPFWEWGRFPEEWERACKEWTGELTVRTLLTLRAHGRIEGIASELA